MLYQAENPLPPPQVNGRAGMRHLEICGSFPPLLGEVAADHREADGGGYKTLRNTA